MSERKLKAYLFVIDSSTMKLSSALKKIDDDRKIENWQKILPDAATLVSRLPLIDLHDLLKNLFPEQRYILVSLEGTSKNGWLPKDAWSAMNRPTSVFDRSFDNS